MDQLCVGAYVVGMGFGIAKKSYHTTISTALAAAVNTGLSFLLTPDGALRAQRLRPCSAIS
jgi:hypothetical protein